MGKKRMFTTEIIESDAFLTMPQSTQNLYFHLNMHADDDGFVNNPISIMNLIKSNNDDMNILLQKKFVIMFEDKGLIVIKHWRMHNYLRSDRYKETNYLEEKAQLSIDDKGIYHKSNESNIKQIKSENVKRKFGEYQHVQLTDEQYTKLRNEFGIQVDSLIRYLDEYIEMKGYKAKNHYLAIKKWVVNAVEEESFRNQKLQRIQSQQEDEITPKYEDKNNPALDSERLKEILKKRSEK